MKQAEKQEEKRRRKPLQVGVRSELSRRVEVRAARKLKGQQAQHQASQTIWSGLGMIGLVGWSVAVPTLLGAALGMWLDKNYPMNHSWTLTLLIIGLITVA